MNTKPKIHLAIACVICLTAGILAGYLPGYYSDTQNQGDAFTQVSTIDAIVNGLLAGSIKEKNIFHAVKLEGTFDYVKARSVTGQQKPYPPLVEVTANQPIFEFKDVKGTIVGFYSPDYVEGSKINVPGYHLHFRSGKMTGGTGLCL